MSGSPRRLRDMLALTKPEIIRMCLVSTVGGLWSAPSRGGDQSLIWISALVGCALIVGAANALNMVWERDTDRLMARTRNRPVAAGRIEARTAVAFAGMLGTLAIIIFVLGTNLLTAGLAVAGLAAYVLVYTPLKRVSPLALLVGAFPGAVPPLLGWTAVSGSLEAPAWVLFGILLVWQMPHFIAIALYRKSEYERAGIRCVPVVRGDRVAKWQAIAWAALLIPVSLALTPLGVTSIAYFSAAAMLSVGFFAWSLTGLRAGADIPWARRFFVASIFYLPALTAALVLDRLFFF